MRARASTTKNSYFHPDGRKKNQAAVALSKLGASKGGKARAFSLTPKQRSAAAKKAALARWDK